MVKPDRSACARLLGGSHIHMTPASSALLVASDTMRDTVGVDILNNDAAFGRSNLYTHCQQHANSKAKHTSPSLLAYAIRTMQYFVAAAGFFNSVIMVERIVEERTSLDL